MLDGMPTHDELLFSGNPFWFANEGLLTDLLRDEIRLVTQLFAKNLDLSEFFDLPEAGVQQRAACFALLAHRTLMEWIDETFLGRYQASPSLGDEEKDVLGRVQNLFADDAPSWVLEVNGVAELLPSRIFDSLPEPLRRGGFYASDPAQAEVINSAAVKLSSVQEIQTLSGYVFDQQLQRLKRRWAAQLSANPSRGAGVRGRESKKHKRNRTHDKQRMLRDKAIAAIDDAAQDIYEFLKIMDERKVRPQPTWSEWPGSWREAYKNPHLRELIHKDKSRALVRVRKRRGK
jgi:hypothetical protein